MSTTFQSALSGSRQRSLRRKKITGAKPTIKRKSISGSAEGDSRRKHNTCAPDFSSFDGEDNDANQFGIRLPSTSENLEIDNDLFLDPDLLGSDFSFSSHTSPPSSVPGSH